MSDVGEARPSLFQECQAAADAQLAIEAKEELSKGASEVSPEVGPVGEGNSQKGAISKT